MTGRESGRKQKINRKERSKECGKNDKLIVRNCRLAVKQKKFREIEEEEEVTKRKEKMLL